MGACCDNSDLLKTYWWAECDLISWLSAGPGAASDPAGILEPGETVHCPLQLVAEKYSPVSRPNSVPESKLSLRTKGLKHWLVNYLHLEYITAAIQACTATYPICVTYCCLLKSYSWGKIHLL